MSTYRLPSTSGVARVTPRQRYRRVLGVALVLAVHASIGPARAQDEHPGTLDVTFDGDGIATTRIGITTDEGRAVAIQDDGRVVIQDVTSGQ